MKRRIAVVFHRHDVGLPEKTQYFIRLLRDEWIGMGMEVPFVRGISKFVPADVAISHVDLTHTPAEYLDFLSRYPATVNANLTDISKARISSNVVSHDSDWKGPVIVKSNLNSKGGPEERIARAADRSRISRRILRRLGFWTPPQHGPMPDYKIYDTIHEVPFEAHSDPRWVVERFLPEMESDTYVLRLLLVLGSRVISAKARSPKPIVKSADFIEDLTVENPPGLAERVRALGVEYGKVDYVIRDGEPVILDVNRTPTCARPPRERNLLEAKTLAPAILEFL